MALGVLLLFGAHVAAVVVSAGIGLVFLGALQLLYVVPLWLAARRSARRGIAIGIAIGAAVTLLANAAWWGVLALGSRS